MASTPSEQSRDGWRVAALFARVLVGGLFVLTASAKIANPLGFAEEIQNYQLAPIAATHAMAIVLPWLEGVVGLLLLLGVWRVEARFMIAAMLVVFTVAKAYSYFVLGKTGSCGCGGDIVVLDALLANPQGLLTNLVLLALLFVDWRAQRLKTAALIPGESAIGEPA